MNSRVGKIISCVLDENKKDFSSLLRDEIEERMQSLKKNRYPEIIEKYIFPTESHQTLNINENEYENSIKIIPILVELADRKSNVSVIFSDNSETTISSNEVENIVRLHDALNEENQIKLRSSLVASKESFKNCANFASKYTRKKVR